MPRYDVCHSFSAFSGHGFSWVLKSLALLRCLVNNMAAGGNEHGSRRRACAAHLLHIDERWLAYQYRSGGQPFEVPGSSAVAYPSQYSSQLALTQRKHKWTVVFILLCNFHSTTFKPWQVTSESAPHLWKCHLPYILPVQCEMRGQFHISFKTWIDICTRGVYNMGARLITSTTTSMHMINLVRIDAVIRYASIRNQHLIAVDFFSQGLW